MYNKLLGRWSNNSLLAEKKSEIMKNLTAENGNLWNNEWNGKFPLITINTGRNIL